MKTMEMTCLSDLYVEWCASVDRRGGLMLPLLRLDLERKQRYDPGFRSVYAFDRQAYDEIKQTGTSRGFRRYEPYSDLLIIDLDNGDKDLEKLTKQLKGYSYRVYTSGSKGYHIEVDTPLYCGHELPQAHKEYVESLGIAADASLYRHSSIVALEGRIHHKTGKRKALIKSIKGELLSIPKPVNAPQVRVAIDADDCNLEWIFTRLANLAAFEPTQGWRHTKLWSIAESMRSQGFQYDTALDLLTRINDQWKNPKAAAEVELAVKQAYQSSSNRYG